MLAVVEPGNLDAVAAACERWQTNSAVIGEVTGDGVLRILAGGDEVGAMPVDVLVDGCPLYDLEPADPGEWIYGNQATLDAGGRPAETLLALISSPNIASKRWAFEQYDSVVGSRTVRRPEQADAAVLLVPESDRAIAISIDGNGRRVACDPYAGAVEAVLECSANLACTGAEPLGLTNCLNFGNPEKPGVAWQLTRAVEGLAAACEALGVPVVGGNVSLYNETAEGPIYPTPVVGMVGELPYAEAVPGIGLRAGDAIGLFGPFKPSLAGSELAKQRGELGRGLPEPDIEAVKAAHAAVRKAVRGETLRSVHDISDGGLACALAEMTIAGGTGAVIDLAPLVGGGTDPEDALFGEGPGGFLLAGEKGALESLGAAVVGEAGGSQLEISAGALSFAVGVADAETAWRSLGERLS
jgi:phosphoribosylformylglycinamidine synthase